MNTTFQSLSSITPVDIDIIGIGKSLILDQIGSIRSNLNLLEGDTVSEQKQSSQNFPPVAESYCHAFYRILGLPVIHGNKVDFYNPGYYGDEDTQEDIEKRLKVDTSVQDFDLSMFEMRREQICNENHLAFNNANLKIEYRLEMMKAPMPINMLDPSPNFDPFSLDVKQINANFPKRNKFKNIGKILRPFKCVSYLVNNVVPSTNRVCAPFIVKNGTLNKTLTCTYLEFVSRVRFSSDVKRFGDSDLYKSLKTQIGALNDSAGSNILSDFAATINSFTDVETYIFLQLFISFVSICIKVKETRIKNQDLGNQLYNKLYNTGENASIDKTGKIQLGYIDRQIDQKKRERAEKSIILGQLPASGVGLDGIRLSNPINCITNNTFVSLVQGDINNVNNQIKELEQQKNNQLAMFNSINDSSFYVVGEVTGMGLIDAICLMMSFWLLPQDQLLSMLDSSSFNRLYREPKLHNAAVEKRKSGNYMVAMSEVIKSMDKIVFNLLKIASNIVSSGNKTS